MTICLVSHTGGLGGAELAILETAAGLVQEGHRVAIVSPNEGPFIAKARSITDQVTIISFDHWTAYGQWNALTKIKMARGYWLAARKLGQYYEEVSADLIVTNTSTFPSAAIAAKSRGLPHLWYLHEFVEEDHGLTWEYSQEKSYKLIDRLSAGVIVNSRAVQAKVARYIRPDKLHLVYCATVTELKRKVRSAPSSPLRLVMAGSISEGKNALLALEALSILKNKGLEARLSLVGNADPVYQIRLEDYLTKNDLRDWAEIKPYSNSLQSEFDAADAYLLTSRHEAFGRVLVEAGRAGLPCIASDAGGAPEIITDQQNGLLFQSGNAADLAQAIEQLISVPALYPTLAANAAPMANEHFGLSQHLTQFRHAMEAAVVPVLK